MKPIKRLVLGLTALLCLSALFAADTTTTRMGLTEPELNSSGWATKTNTNWGIVDSSSALLSETNAFTGTNSFAGTTKFPNLTASQCLTLDSQNQVATQACSTPPGSDTQVIFNQGGVFAGDADFTFNGTTASITGVATSTMTIRRIVWPDGTIQISSPTSTAGPAGASGTSVYAATATASFPYGLSASTVSVSTAAITTLTDGAGSNVMTTGASTQLIVSSITFPDGTIIGSTRPFSASISAILKQDTLQTGASFYVLQGEATKIIVDSTFTVNGTSITLGNTSSQLDIPAMGTTSKFMRAGNGSSLITSYDLLGGTQTWTGSNTLGSSTTITGSTILVSTGSLQSGATVYVSSVTAANLNTTTLKFADGTSQTTAASSSSTFIQSRETLQSGATFYVSSGTITGPLHLTGVLDVGTYTTGFGNLPRISFDPSTPSPQLNLYNNNSIGSGADINFINSSGVTFASLSASIAGKQIQIPAAAAGGLTVTYGISAGSMTVTNLTASQFVKTDGSKGLASYDLLNATQTWTGSQTYQSSAAFVSSGGTYEATFSSSSSPATFFHVAVSTSGHFITGGPKPIISSCGSTPNGSVVGDDNQGTITVGGGSVTSCTLTFASTWGTTPTCVITDNSTAITGDISAISSTAMTTSFSLSIGGGLIYYRCGCSGSSCR